MPKATMNKNHFPQPRKNKIRRPWQIFPVETIAKSHSVYELPNHHFRLSVLSFDARHHLGALFG